MIEIDYQAGHYEYSVNYGYYWESRPNSAGGLGVIHTIKNIGDKTIKYVAVYYTAYNRVGDVIPSYVHEKINYGIKVTGPIEPNKKSEKGYVENIWYDTSISSIKISKASIEYMDGSIEDIQGDLINKIGTHRDPNASSDGCYVATAVYGSYDCPQVWTLRRYRDVVLRKTQWGCLFVSFYYAISPFFVRHFGNSAVIKKIWKYPLDRIVSRLQNLGFSSLPYDGN